MSEDGDFRALCLSEAEQEGGGLYAVAYALMSIAYQIKYLGNGNAATQMGAIENLAKEVRDAGQAIASALEALGR